MSALTEKLQGYYHDTVENVQNKMDDMKAEKKKAEKKEKEAKEKNSSMLWTVTKWGLLFFGVRKLYQRLAV